MPTFACCVAGPSEFFYKDFQSNVQELRLQARFFKGLGWAITCQITLRRISLDLIDKKWKLVQAITWAKFIPEMCRHMTSLGHNKVIELYIDSSFTDTPDMKRLSVNSICGLATSVLIHVYSNLVSVSGIHPPLRHHQSTSWRTYISLFKDTIPFDISS